MMFLKSDEDRALKEIGCHGRCVRISKQYFMNNEFEKASIYLKNASRSLRELGQMKRTKQTVDDQLFQIEQIRGQQAINKQIQELKNQYEQSH